MDKVVISMEPLIPQTKKYYFNTFLLLSLGFFWMLNLYSHLSKVDNGFFVDLRNRVVGARLMEQHISPYFFKWDSSYSETLLDPVDKCNIRNNMITSPPSVLLLMRPLTKLSYADICYSWVVIHYIFFLLVFIPFYIFFRTPGARMTIIMAGIVLLYSGQWVNSVFQGQSHFVLPAFLAGIICISAMKWQYRFILIGLLFSFIVWIRPNALMIFPFMLFCRQVNRQHLVGGLISGGLLFIGLTFLSHHEYYWIDFYYSCKEWIKNNVSGVKYVFCGFTEIVEGKYVMYQGEPPARYDAETGNLVVIFKKIFGFTANQSLIAIASIATYLTSLYISYKRPFILLPEALLMGMLMYWLSEMATPVGKASYYYVELFIVIFYLSGKLKQLTISEKIILFLSFLFLFLDFVPLNMVIAELFLMTGLGIYLLNELKYNKIARPD